MEQQKYTSYRWVILFAAYVSALSVMISIFKLPPLFPELSQFYGVPLAAVSLAGMTAFGIGAGVTAIPLAIVFPKLMPKKAGILCVSLVIIGTLVTLLTMNYIGFFVGRFIEGMALGYAFVYPIVALSFWFPPKDLGKVLGILVTFLPVGALIAFILAPILSAMMNWTGIEWFSLAWSVAGLIIWGVLFKNPPYMQTPAGSGPQTMPTVNIKNTLLNRDLLLLAFSFFAIAYLGNSVSILLPTYLQVVGHFDPLFAAILALLPTLMMLWAAPVVGAIDDKTHQSKKLIIISLGISFLLGFVILFVGFNPISLILYFVVAGSFWAMAYPPLMAAPPKIVGALASGLAMGEFVTMLSLCFVFGPLITSILAGILGWQWAMVAAGLPALIGVLAAAKSKLK